MKELARLRAASLRPALPPAGSGALTAPPWSWPATLASVTCSPGVSRSPGEGSRLGRGGAGFPARPRERGRSPGRAGQLVVIR